MTSTHALRNRWFVSFLPLITEEMVNTDFQGNWPEAAQKLTQKLDWITSVEELWSTMNSLPKIHLLGVGKTLIFAREDVEPSFESFPDGSRIVVNLTRPPATEVGLELVLATVMGETIAKETSDGRPVCDVIRIAARPAREHTEQVRVEVWLNDATCSSAVAAFLAEAFKSKDLAASTYNISELSFDGGAAKEKKPAGSPTETKATAPPESSKN